MVGSNSEMGGEIIVGSNKPDTPFIIVGLILGGVVDGVADDATAVSGESATRSRRRIKV